MIGSRPSHATPRRNVARLLFFVVFVLTMFGLASPASAHSDLIRTTPEAGARLGTAPGAVVLEFSEAIDPSASTAVVAIPDGRRVTGHAKGRSIVLDLTTNAPGEYRVTWRAVSAEDGHTIGGSFRFAVGTAQGPGVGGSSGTQAGQDALFAVGRTVEYTALLLASGVLVLALLTRKRPDLAWVEAATPSRLRLALLAAFVSTLVVVAGEAAAAEGSFSLDSLGTFLSTGLPGASRLALLAFEALALASVAARSAWITTALVAGALVAVAAASHAAAIHPISLTVAVDAVHLLAAAVWAGGILALITLRPPAGWRGDQARGLLTRFSSAALPAFLVSVAFGAVQGLQQIGGALSRLVTTSYGLVLLLKIAAVAAMIPLSWAAWRRRMFRRVEGAVALAVVVVAAVLSVLPLPNLARSEAHAGASGLPRPGDLTLGGHAGQFLLGLSLDPGDPGMNRVRAYLKPVEGRVAGVPVDLAVGGRTQLMHRCGTTCRELRLNLRGGERLTVTVAHRTGGDAEFDIPELPAPDGARLFEKVQRRMHSLSTYRLAESLSSGLGATVRANYRFQAPDRMSSEVRSNGETRTVWIGNTRYLKQPGAPWQVEHGGLSQRVPSFIWDSFRPRIDFHVIGSETVDGVRTRVLAFFSDRADTPIWFLLWVDSTGLVHRAHMRAFGHFMDHRYYDFDAPLTIRPPNTEEGAGS